MIATTTPFPEKQSSWLFNCLKNNETSYYGQLYGFNKIDTLQAYIERVPLIDYETIAPYIQRIAKGEKDLLFRGEPAAFEITGGSSGGGKLIPYTDESFLDFQRAVLPWFGLIAQRYGISGKAAYWSISPALNRSDKTESGMKIGVSDAAYLGEEAGSALESGMVVPSWVGALHDVKEWQLATLYWLVRCRELELVSVWSPTFLLMLLDVLDARHEEIKSLLIKGGKIAGHTVEPDSQAVKRLELYVQKKSTACLWPELKLISCWQDASSAHFSQRLRHRFPGVAFQPKGLISTEGVVTMPDAEDMPLLSADSGFYEFLDADGGVHLPQDLVQGEHYEVVMTTSAGLYRYKTGDVVKYEGVKNKLPILRFTGRNGNVSDMVGEKLTDAFVREAFDLQSFMMLVADDNDYPHYVLVGDTEAVIEKVIEIETNLRQNPQYAYARTVGQLGDLEPVVVNNVMRLYIDYKTSSGSRVGDIKIPALQTDHEWLKIIKEVTA